MLKNYKNTFTTSLIVKILSALLFLLPLYNCIAQETIQGKIISDIDNYEEIAVVNSTRNAFTKIDDTGEFEIRAFLNDTIKINSHSYAEDSFIITEKHLENGIKISLKDNVENLKEIIIDTNIINDEELAEINLQLQNQIKNDIKNNPYEYTKPNPGGNLFGIVLLVIDLFSKKTPENSKPPEVFISHQDLATYFQEDTSFLIEELTIPENQISYFFLFIEDEQVSAEFLTESNRFFFLEELSNLSSKFFQKENN